MQVHLGGPVGQLLSLVLNERGASPVPFDARWDLAVLDRDPAAADKLDRLPPTDGDQTVSVVPGASLLLDPVARWERLAHALGDAASAHAAPAHPTDDGLPEGLWRVDGTLVDASSAPPGRVAVRQPDAGIVWNRRFGLRAYVAVERHAGFLTAWRHPIGHVHYAESPWRGDPTDAAAGLPVSTPTTESLQGLPHTVQSLFPWLRTQGVDGPTLRTTVSRTLHVCARELLTAVAATPAPEGYRFLQLFAADLVLTNDWHAVLVDLSRPDLGARTLDDAERKCAVLRDWLRLGRLVEEEGHGAWVPLVEVRCP
jgi:hypothetical protein